MTVRSREPKKASANSRTANRHITTTYDASLTFDHLPQHLGGWTATIVVRGRPQNSHEPLEERAVMKLLHLLSQQNRSSKRDEYFIKRTNVPPDSALRAWESLREPDVIP